MTTTIAETEFSTGNSIEVPTQLVLKSEKEGEFVSRFKTMKGTEFTGHYHKGLQVDAEQLFVRRVNKHNEDYPEGNASHVGPIKWMCADE